MSDQVRDGWADWLKDRMSPEEWENWPAGELASWVSLTADPETAHGTVCVLAQDRQGDIATTETLLIRGKCRTIRRIKSTHYLARKDDAVKGHIL